MNVKSFLGGTVCLELVDANPLQTLHQANEMGIDILRLQKIDELTVRFRILRKDFETMDLFVKRKGGRLICKGVYGVYQLIRPLLFRPIILVGFLILTILTFSLPNVILFVQVVGNQSVSEQQIIEAAALCGIEFGASRRAIRSEKIKNALLERVPQLQWLGVNTYGCTAVIAVQEKTALPPEKTPASISSIVASRDGVIENMIVSSGTPLCEPGQVVRKGQLLVSGYSDCGICIHGTRSEADIMASTQHDLDVVTPINYQKRTLYQRQSKKYSLIIGKKRINFYKGSGISTPTCGKMYVENCITLPGGFQLPIALVTEISVHAPVETTVISSEHNEIILSDFARRYLKQNMVAGEMIGSSEKQQRQKYTDRLRGTYMCREMIGRVRIEETIE